MSFSVCVLCVCVMCGKIYIERERDCFTTAMSKLLCDDGHGETLCPADCWPVALQSAQKANQRQKARTRTRVVLGLSLSRSLLYIYIYIGVRPRTKTTSGQSDTE